MNKFQQQQGLTILELIVGLLVLSILTYVSTYSIRNALTESSLRSTAEELAQTLVALRLQALIEKKDVKFSYDQTIRRFFVEGEGRMPLRALNNAINKKFAVTVSSPRKADEIVLYESGVGTPATIILTSADKKKNCKVITALRAAPRIDCNSNKL
jgi:Tfp pilus assembly protein FimT